MGKSTLSMAIFHCFLYVHQRVFVAGALGDSRRTAWGIQGVWQHRQVGQPFERPAGWHPQIDWSFDHAIYPLVN